MVLFLLFLMTGMMNLPAVEDLFSINEKSRESRNLDLRQNKILWINHINLVVTKILTYNDKLVLTLEYEKLVDTINYNNLPKGALRGAIKELIQTLKVLSDSWDEKEFARKEYVQACDKAFRKALFDGAKTGFSAAKSAVMLDYQGAIYRAADVSASFVNYQELKNQLENQHSRQMREITKADARRIHELRNRIWDIFSSEFNTGALQDQDRISVQDCKSFLNILKNGSPAGQYAVLSGINNQTRFRCLPVFWYYLGSAAVKLNKDKEALIYLDRFNKIYRDLFRYDTYATNALILEIKILIQDQTQNRSKIIAKLKELVKNIENRDWKSRYFAALCYIQLKETDTAVKLLRQNIEYLNIQTREASNPPVRDLFGSPNIPMELLPDGESLSVNRRLLNMTLLKNGENEKKILRELMNDFAVSSFEKTQYLGSVGNHDFFNLIEKDISGISLQFCQRAFKPYVELQVPAPWFYVTRKPDFSLEFLDMKKGNIIRVKNYTATSWNTKNHSVIMHFPIKSGLIPEQSEIVLNIHSLGLSLDICYRVHINESEKKPDQPDSKWKKFQEWTKDKYQQGKDAWSKVYDYRQIKLTINDQTFPLDKPFSGDHIKGKENNR